MTTPTPVYGRVKHPAYERRIVPKPVHRGSAWGYIYVPQGRTILGTVEHQTGGRDTPQSIYNLFGPGGERYGDALTDYVTGKDGTLWMLNDPEGTRAGWANGGGVGLAGGLEGDGPAFFAKHGAWGIDTQLVSNENCLAFSEPNLTPQQIQRDGELEAFWHDRARCPWDTYPLNPNQAGIVYSFLHFEFGTTTCGKTMLDDITKIQAVAKGILKQAQIGGDASPVPPEVPPQPDPEIPGGLSLATARRRFGKLRLRLPDGRTVERGFHPRGGISLAWARRAAKEKVWPAAADGWILLDEGKEIQVITFEGSWVLLKKAPRHTLEWV